MKLNCAYTITDGVLKGTILEPTFCFIGVKYPHRKTKDLYCPPLKDVKVWHCCQCDTDFKTEELEAHLIKHAGKLVKRCKEIENG